MCKPEAVYNERMLLYIVSSRLASQCFFKFPSVVKMYIKKRQNKKKKTKTYPPWVSIIRVLCLLCYIICWWIMLDKMLNKENDTFAVIGRHARPPARPTTHLPTVYIYIIYKLLYVHNKFRRVCKNANIMQIKNLTISKFRWRYGYRCWWW